MTTSPEGEDGERTNAALGESPRERAERAQEAALPEGRVVVSCSAAPGSGGLGRNLSEIVAALDFLFLGV